MIKLPDNLLHVSEQFWPQPGMVSTPVVPDALDITIVTAFFDLGRGSWKVKGAKPSPWQRTNSDYLNYFSHLAQLKNAMVIFTSPDIAPQVLQLRKQAGLENATVIFTIGNLFEEPLLARLIAEVASKMTDAFRASLRAPLSPEYNFPNYVVLDALKSVFVMTAIAAQSISSRQAAWLDFGYCRDEKCFDKNLPWQFDTGGLMHIFHMRPLDDLPVFKVVQRGTVYFQGGCKIGPVVAWADFARDIDSSLAALLAADMVDDEQTLVLMAWRKNPRRFKIHPMDKSDWRVAIRQYTREKSGEKVAFTDYRWVARIEELWLVRMLRRAAIAAIRKLDILV